ncbi:hypothetical protein SMCB_1249 [Serpentinimonas maccroryi]|uniref:Uncharacterized protein n=1 Tax=Serpentinimonas maccroryi TaxID=1458426 RepID=A0A060NNY9_9BURK|nr:hypothetical protein SMCB_1249 [Serpentinimonas maccroryi]
MFKHRHEAYQIHLVQVEHFVCLGQSALCNAIQAKQSARLAARMRSRVQALQAAKASGTQGGEQSTKATAQIQNPQIFCQLVLQTKINRRSVALSVYGRHRRLRIVLG